MSSIKKALWVLLLLLLFCGAFLAGGIKGFNEGYAYSVFHRSSSEAYFTLRSLELINSGKTEEAKKQLERRLDTYIIEHYSGLDIKSFFSFMQLHDEEAINKLMGKVAAYRKDHQVNVEDPEVKKGIDTVIARYTNK